MCHRDMILPGPSAHGETADAVDAQLRHMRLRSQGLAQPLGRSVVDVVRHMVGLQAQDTRMARLLVRPRGAGVDATRVDQASAVDRTVVRTWAMRGTLHMVAAEDLHWLIDLLGPVFIDRGRRRRHQLGLDDETCERAAVVLPDVLAGRQLTRDALIREIRARGVEVPGGQAPAHLVAYAALRGVICRGRDLTDNQPRYVLTAEWIGDGDAVDPNDGVTIFARRYLTAYGPAGVADFAAWSGLPVGQARVGIESVAGEFDQLATGRGPAWVRAGTSAEPAPSRLIGHFDPYLLGYRTREFALDPAFGRRIQGGGGFILPAVLVDGRVAGTWRLKRTRGMLAIKVELFWDVDDASVMELETEARDIGRFFGLKPVFQLDRPRPLEEVEGEPARNDG